MADVKISQLSAASTLTGTEIVPVVQSSTTVRTTAQAIANLAPSAGVPNSWTGSSASQFAGTASFASTVRGSIFTGANIAASASFATTASYVLGGGGGAAFPYTGSARITGSLTVTGDITIRNTVTGSNEVTNGNQLVSAGSLTANMSNLSGSFANRTLPAGYSSYYIYADENSGGSSTIKLWNISDISYTGPVLLSLQSGNSATIKGVKTIEGFGPAETTITTLAGEEWIILVYDQGNQNSWSIVSRGTRGINVAPFPYTGSARITGSLGVTGSVNITGSLLLNGSSVGSAFPYTGSAQISGSLGVTGSISTNLSDNRYKLISRTINAGLYYPVPGSGYNSIDFDFFTGNTYNQALFPIVRPYAISATTDTAAGLTFASYKGNLGIGVSVEDLNTSYRGLESIFINVRQTNSPDALNYQVATGESYVFISDGNSLPASSADSTWLLYSGANGRAHVLTVTGSMLARDGVSLGTNINNTHFITGSTAITGSVTIDSILRLQRRTTTPATPQEGMIIASGSAGASVLYYYNGSTWNALF